MYVIGNPILGKIFKRSQLILNQDGLWRRVRVVSGKHKDIFITKNPVDILALLEIDYDDFNNAEDEGAYELVMNSPYANLLIFSEGKPKGSVALEGFRQYLLKVGAEIPPTNISKPIRTEYIEAVCDIELRDEIDRTKEILNSPSKNKFNQMKAELLKRGYVPQNFSRDIPNFMGSFKNNFEYLKYLDDNDIEDVVSKFLFISELNGGDSVVEFCMPTKEEKK